MESRLRQYFTAGDAFFEVFSGVPMGKEGKRGGGKKYTETIKE